jgi:hypothetical protein
MDAITPADRGLAGSAGDGLKTVEAAVMGQWLPPLT